MKFYSTNHSVNPVSFSTAIMKGMPEDNGLYMPESIPDLSKIINQNTSLSFQEISYLISSKFVKNCLTNNQLHNIIENSMTFDPPNKRINDNTYCLELFHGPTLAFKDFGARFMARCMENFIGNYDKSLNILVATSGDTGSAVASGFYKVNGINVIILYPKGKVSAIQEKQLTTLEGNITALEIEGSFDDCQNLVKKAFLDRKLNKTINLSSANSINIARLIPQSFYYVYSYMQLKNKKLPTIFSVPSGNFGNITAGLLSKKMGLPVSRFIGSTNINDIVPKYLETGNFLPKVSKKTISNAMDVGNPSNIVRIIDLFKNVPKIKESMLSWSFNEKETSRLILNINKKYNYLLDPHSAIGLLGIYKYLELNHQPSNNIFLGTAHPAKFCDIIENIINRKVELPDRLSKLLSKKKKSIVIKNDYNEFYDYLIKTFQ
jgi:threonine synthase